MAFQPGLAGSQFPGEDYIVRRIQDLEKTVQQLAAANPFAPMGIAPTADGFTVTGTETVTGALVVNGPETVNGTQTVNGPLNVNGAMAVTGTLSLPAGIIGNDALASPVSFGNSSTATLAFALATTDVAMASGTIAVPAGYTQAQVFMIGEVGAINPNTAGDFVRASAVINGVASRESFGYCAGSSGSVEVVTAKSTFLTGLSGGNITVAVNVHAQNNAWTADASNRAYVEAFAVFLR